jgi:MFS family permease
MASLAWAFSFGLGAPLASLWLHDHGLGYRTVGLNTGIYYLGIALTAGLVPRLMRRWGAGCVATGCLVSGVTVALFPYAGSLVGYHVLRLVNGVAAAMTLIPLETAVNRDSPPKYRSRNFGYYALAIAIGWALGNWVGLELYPTAPRLAFLLGGAAALVACALIRGRLPQATIEETYDRRAPLHFRRNILNFGTAWAQGFLEGGMVGFLALYLLSLGMSEDRVSWLTSSIMIGVILFQVPVAWFADRLGRTQVLLGCYAVVIAGLCFLPFCGDSAWLALWLFLVGACSGAFYPLGLAVLGERIAPSGLARANAWFLGVNCLGSWMGPDIMGFVMEEWGKRALFVTGLTAILAVLLCWLGMRWYHLRHDLHAHAVADLGSGSEQRLAA